MCRFFTFTAQKSMHMLSQQQELVLSEYSALYNIVVSQDNLLRRINGLVDISFVYQDFLDFVSFDIFV